MGERVREGHERRESLGQPHGRPRTGVRVCPNRNADQRLLRRPSAGSEPTTLLFIGIRGSEAPDLVFGTPDAAANAIESRRSDAAAPPELRAIDKATGATVHSVVLPAAPTGSPMTYTAGGKQYIVLAYGAGSQTGLLGLALP